MTSADALPLDEKVVVLGAALGDARIPFAFGGALALAYYAEPRATIDIDVNLFVPPERGAGVLRTLGPLGVDVADADLADRIARDGQVRLWWAATPVDCFFGYDPFHEAAAERIRTVPFGDVDVPILAPEDLTVCKAVFARRKDWLDIEQVLVTTAGDLDTAEVLAWVERIVGASDERAATLRGTIVEILGPDPA